MGIGKRIIVFAAALALLAWVCDEAFGNVYGSDGSVIPLWREQIANGGPVTITDKRCTRYFMSVDDACRLIIAVAHMNQHGTYLFDTLGDDQPGGEWVADLDFRVAGPPPGLDTHPCDYAAELIG